MSLSECRVWSALPVLMVLTFLSCSQASQIGAINANFPDIGGASISPSTSVDPNNQDRVVVVEPGPAGQGGMIGSIADQDPGQTLCVVVDPAAGQDVDLIVCESSQVNQETTAVNSVCPSDASAGSCVSRNSGSGPDFCQITGGRDYIFVIVNASHDDVTVAYQVVDITAEPNKSCADLNLTEDTIHADDF